MQFCSGKCAEWSFGPVLLLSTSQYAALLLSTYYLFYTSWMSFTLILMSLTTNFCPLIGGLTWARGKSGARIARCPVQTQARTSPGHLHLAASARNHPALSKDVFHVCSEHFLACCCKRRTCFQLEHVKWSSDCYSALAKRLLSAKRVFWVKTTSKGWCDQKTP